MDLRGTGDAPQLKFACADGFLAATICESFRQDQVYAEMIAERLHPTRLVDGPTYHREIEPSRSPDVAIDHFADNAAPHPRRDEVLRLKSVPVERALARSLFGRRQRLFAYHAGADPDPRPETPPASHRP